MAEKKQTGPVGHMSDRQPATWQQALDDGKFLLASATDPAEAIGCKIQAVLNVASFGAELAFPMPHGPFGSTSDGQAAKVEEVVTQLMEKCPECAPAYVAGAPMAGFSWLAALAFLAKFLEMFTKQQAEAAQ